MEWFTVLAGVVGLALAFVACDSAPSKREPPPRTEAAHIPTVERPESPRRPAPPAATVSKWDGQAFVGESHPAPKMPARDTRVHTAQGSLSLDTVAGVRLVLGPETQVLFSERFGQAYLPVGTLRVTRPPAGGSAGTPQERLVTIAGTVLVEATADIEITARAKGTVELKVHTGRVRVQQGTNGPSLIEARWVRAGQTWTGSAPKHKAVVATLVGALALAEATQAKARELSERHREAVIAKSGEANALQRALVDHSKALRKARSELMVAWEAARLFAWMRASKDAQRRGLVPIGEDPRVYAVFGWDSK